VIAEYAEALAGKLGFDRSLASRVRQEVEDHLWEAVAADPAGDSLEAQRRAIARFGDPQLIAAQLAAASLAERMRKIGVTVVLVIAGIFVAMKMRVAWYELTDWALCESGQELSETLGMIDRIAFWLALAGGIAGWACISLRGAQAAFYSAFRPAFHTSARERARRFFLLCSVATGGLIAAVISDGVLTALRLSGWDWSAYFLIPLFTMAIEIACAALLVFHVREAARRVARAGELLESEAAAR
jgi:hypothetical protein